MHEIPQMLLLQNGKKERKCCEQHFTRGLKIWESITPTQKLQSGIPIFPGLFFVVTSRCLLSDVFSIKRNQIYFLCKFHFISDPNYFFTDLSTDILFIYISKTARNGYELVNEPRTQNAVQHQQDFCGPSDHSH